MCIRDSCCNQRSRLDKCGSCCVKPIWQTACAFSAVGGTCAHAFSLPDTPLHAKVTFRKTENQVIENRNTWFVAEHLEQILTRLLRTMWHCVTPWRFGGIYLCVWHSETNCWRNLFISSLGSSIDASDNILWRQCALKWQRTNVERLKNFAKSCF